VLNNKEEEINMRDERGGFRRERSFDRGPRKMFKAVCTECGRECEVPFKPTEGRPIFCKDCFMKKRRY
jgi:CxxC-x17-CxxC domain-containing protein